MASLLRHVRWNACYYASALLCCVLAFLTGVNNTDLTTFYVPWGDALMQHGIGGVYANSNCDYPPILVYPFWFPAFFARAFAVTSHHTLGLLYKLLPIAAVLISGVLAADLARLAGVSEYDVRRRFLPFVLFNPPLIYVSAVWGQTDSVVVALLFAILVMAVRGRLFAICLIAMLGFLSKPQMAFALPFLAVYALARFPIPRIVASAVAAIGVSLALCVPLLRNLPARWLLDYYVNRPGTYRYATMSAGTLPGLLAGNYHDDTALAFASFSVARVSLVTLLVFAIVYVAIVHRGQRRLGLLSDPFALTVALATSMFGVYVLSSRMHERYALYGTVLIGFLTCWRRWPLEVRLLLGWGLSVVVFYQVAATFPAKLSDSVVSSELWGRFVRYEWGVTAMTWYQLAAFVVLFAMFAREFLRQRFLPTTKN